MAAFFFDAYYQKKKKYKPLVVVGPVDAEGNCNVIGFSGPPTSSSKARAWLPSQTGRHMITAAVRSEQLLCPSRSLSPEVHMDSR